MPTPSRNIGKGRHPTKDAEAIAHTPVRALEVTKNGQRRRVIGNPSYEERIAPPNLRAELFLSLDVMRRLAKTRPTEITVRRKE